MADCQSACIHWPQALWRLEGCRIAVLALPGRCTLRVGGASSVVMRELVSSSVTSFVFVTGGSIQMGDIKWTVWAFVSGAALSWGIYVPMVHDATAKLGSNLRAFLMVGVAYFLVAVLVPGIFIFLLKSDPTAKDVSKLNWFGPSVLSGILAGVSGAVGALCVIFATRDAVASVGPVVGPLVVAPLVFAGAPIINTIASITIFAHGKKFEAPGLLFYVGLALAATGMATVMVNKPKAVPDAKPVAATASAVGAAPGSK